MSTSLHISALLTGRGNNTLADKNVLPVFGKPLLSYPANAAKKVAGISSFYVSSDCEKILSAADGCGYTRILRPDALALPDAQHEDVINHALKVMREQGTNPDIMVVLLANTVTVKADWIETCINFLLENPELTAAVPVYREMDHHPFRAKKVDKSGLLEPFFDFSGKKVSTNRQDLEPSFFLCHNFWVLNLNTINREIGQAPWKFMGNKVKPFEVDEAFDVHTTDDLIKSEKWLVREGLV